MSEELFTVIPASDTVLRNSCSDGLTGENQNFRWFDCQGEAGVWEIKLCDSSYISSGEADVILEILNSNVFSKQKSITCESIELFGITWDKGSVLLGHLNLLFKITRQEIINLENGTKLNAPLVSNNASGRSSNADYSISRKSCVELFLFIRSYLWSLQEDANYSWLLQYFTPLISKEVESVYRCLGHVLSMPSYVYQHCSNNSGNKTSQPAYHLMHLHLDLRWLHLTILLSLSQAKIKFENEPYSQNSSVKLLQHIKLLILELIQLSVARFNKMEMQDVPRKSPFNCSCIQELWLLTLALVDSLYKKGTGQSFWEYFNAVLEPILDGKTEIFSDQWDEYFVPSKEVVPTNPPMFTVWLLFAVARLYNYNQIPDSENVRSNYPLLEAVVKVLTYGDANENHLRKCLDFVEKLCLEIWEPKPEPILIMWEYYNKNLNSIFYIPGAIPDTIPKVSKSAIGLVSQVRFNLSNPTNVTNSYQKFLRILGIYIQKVSNVPRNWNILKGRIYTKFPSGKLQALTAVGEHNFICLFLTLALTANLPQIECKMVELVNNAVNCKGVITLELMKGQLGLITLLAERGMNICKVLQPLVISLNNLSPFEHADIFRVYIEAFQDVLDCHQSLSLGQHLFIGDWIGKCLIEFRTEADITRLTDTLLCFVNRTKRSFDLHQMDVQEVIVITEKIWTQLSSYFSCTSPQLVCQQQVADIAANLAVLFHKLSNESRFKEIFNLFVCHEQTDVKLLRRFLCKLNEYDCVHNSLVNYEQLIIKAWVRCSLTCLDMNHTEMKELTCSISRLKEIRLLSNTLTEDMRESNDPFLEFISAFHYKYTSSQDIYEKQHLREKMNSYMEGIDGWLKPIVCPPKGVDQVRKLYFIVGNIIRLTSPLLYVKSKPKSLLQQLLDLLLLPVSVHNPEERIHPSILSAVRTCLHFFIDGLLQLGPENDGYIKRSLTDLIKVYVPRCLGPLNSSVMSDFSLIVLFDTFDSVMKEFILKTVVVNFTKSKAKMPHANTIHALTLLKEIINNHREKNSVMLSVISSSLERVCDIVMFCDDKNRAYIMAKDLLRNILTTNLVQQNDEAMDAINKVFIRLCNENLAWSTKQFFDFIGTVINYQREIVVKFMPVLCQQIELTEARRGVGYDRILRLNLERIKTAVHSVKVEDFDCGRN